METVLVVDDEYGILEAVEDILQVEGYHVLMASHGRQALECMAGTCPDVVLTDWMMPVMDGLQLIEQMQADPRLRDIPVLLMSAVDLSSLRRQRPELECIQKPFDLDSLLQQVRGALDRRKRAR